VIPRVQCLSILQKPCCRSPQVTAVSVWGWRVSLTVKTSFLTSARGDRRQLKNLSPDLEECSRGRVTARQTKKPLAGAMH